MSLLDQLINEISILTGLSPEEVTQQFTQDQLDELLEASKCEQPDTIAPIFGEIEDVPCKDDSAPSDLVTDLKKKGKFPDGLEEESEDYTSIDQPEESFDGSECVDSVEEVNKKVEAMIKTHTDHNILMNRLYELQDHLKPLKYYYEERERRLSVVLNDFDPPLREKKRLENEKRILKNRRNTLIENRNKLYSNTPITDSVQSQIDSYNSQITSINVNISDINTEIGVQLDIINGKTAKYPSLNDPLITGFRTLGVSVASFIAAITTNVSSSEIISIKNQLNQYSEYINIDINQSFDSYSNFIKSPLIRFNITFQDLNYMNIEREKVDKVTGKRSVYNESFPIKSSTLLLKRSFFNGVPGYTVNNAQSKETSIGSLYTQYYNKFNDPVNEFFTEDERGLTTNSNLVDPQLKGGPGEIKKENDRNFYIKDMETMQNFYKEFDAKIKERTAETRKRVTESGTQSIKTILNNIAKRDIDLIIGTSTVNLYLPEDDESLRTLIDNVSDATKKFIEVIENIEDEISRIEDIIEENKPTPDKIKSMLKSENSKCFDKMDEEVGGCPDIMEKKGTDPFFESLDGCDPTLPNFSQMCYWTEFSKLALIQGLFPIPQDARTLRYWPIGLIIPTPSKLIKIPLPMIWVPLITISTTNGILVFFLNINGLFISPMVFLISSSGYKQHMMTIRGSSKKFGYDKNDESIKSTINLPLSVVATKDMAKFGGSIKPEDYLDDEQKAKIEIAESKKQEAINSNDNIKIKKAEREIEGIKQSAAESVKPESQKMKESAEKGEDIKDMILETKMDIFKSMDDLGKPDLNNINKLKKAADDRKQRLKKQKIAALEKGEVDEAKRISEELKTDGININDKKSAYTKDVMNYFDNIHFPKKVIPRESDKVDPKPNGNVESNEKSKEFSSNLSKEFQSDHASKVKSMVGLNIAKHKESLESSANFRILNVDEDVSKIRSEMNSMSNNLKDKILSTGVSPIDHSSISSQLTDAKDTVEKAKSPDQIEKAKEELNNTQKSISDKLENDRNKQLLSFTSNTISSLSGASISLDPFASCCERETFSFSPKIPDEITSIIGQGISSLTSKIDKMNSDDFRSLFGGKTNITPRDMRLGLLSLSKNIIPDSLSIPKPKINLDSAIKMFSGFLNSMSLPQAKLPESLGRFQMDKKINLNLNILKLKFKGFLEEHLNKNVLEKNSQSLDTDFININPNDLKEFIKTFIDSMDDVIEEEIKPFFDKLKLFKNAKGIDLNKLEKKAFEITPYGPVLKKLFEAKSLIKMNLKKPNFQSIMDVEAIKSASKILKTSINPIVSNPLGYAVVAGAGAIENLDSIRKLHPILNQDDIPPWERLTMKNLLFLVFLDEFLYNGAEQTGFYRSFL